MRHLLPALAVILVIDAPARAAAVLPTEASGNYAALCSEEWTKRGVLDHEMNSYCLKQKRQGYRELSALADKYAGKPWIGGVIDHAIAEYTKRDARDDEMVAYEVKQQTEAFLDYEYAAKQPKFDKDAFEQCRDEYMGDNPDWSMTMYCYKEKSGR